jgi:hypothetical protein
MGSYWKEKEEYERRKRDDETNRAIIGFILSVIGIILTFIFSNILAPLISKYPKASFVVILAVCIGCYFYFANKDTFRESQIEKFEDFASNFSQDENYCKQHIGQIVVAEGYKKGSYKNIELSAKKIMSSIIDSMPQNYTGDDVENELCYGKFSKVSNNKYVYQLKKVSDESLVKLFEFTYENKEWYLTKIQRGGESIDIITVNDSTNISVNPNVNETNFISIEGFNIYVPKNFVLHNRMVNTYVLFDNIGGDSMYFSYEILSIPKGPWDLNPNACNADYTGSANELYVSKNGEDEMSSIWREYKKNDKWCLLEVSYSDDECLSDVYDFLAKSN